MASNSNIFEGELLKRATGSDYLAKRLEMNNSFQLFDFGQWSLDQIIPRNGDRALEVGCGRGAQTIPVSGAIGKGGDITFIDLSEESVRHVLNCIGAGKARGICGSMDNLAELLGSESSGYDLAFSVYALYYAVSPIDVLNVMYQRLNTKGRLCIIGPDGPHGLVEIARKFHPIPAQVDSGFEFRSKVVEPFFKEKFQKFNVSFLKNPQSISDVNQFVEFYRQTTYYVKEAEGELRTFVEREINEKGVLMFDKHSYAVTAEKN